MNFGPNSRGGVGSARCSTLERASHRGISQTRLGITIHIFPEMDINAKSYFFSRSNFTCLLVVFSGITI